MGWLNKKKSLINLILINWNKKKRKSMFNWGISWKKIENQDVCVWYSKDGLKVLLTIGGGC